MIKVRFCILFLFIITIININAQDLCPDNNHPHAIDLGIGVKFACCNVGASAPWEYGNYYAWGEIEKKQHYVQDTYNYFRKPNKYINIGKDIANTKYDVAHVKWGGNWRMPRLEEILALLKYCKSRWCCMKGVYGRIFQSSNGNCIFIPAAGAQASGGMSLKETGNYWTATQYDDHEDMATYFWFSKEHVTWRYYCSRYCGYSVRPVMG